MAIPLSLGRMVAIVFLLLAGSESAGRLVAINFFGLARRKALGGGSTWIRIPDNSPASAACGGCDYN